MMSFGENTLLTTDWFNKLRGPEQVAMVSMAVNCRVAFRCMVYLMYRGWGCANGTKLEFCDHTLADSVDVCCMCAAGICGSRSVSWPAACLTACVSSSKVLWQALWGRSLESCHSSGLHGHDASVSSYVFVISLVGLHGAPSDFDVVLCCVFST